MTESTAEVRILGSLIGYCSEEQFNIECVQYVNFIPLPLVNLKNGHLSYVPLTGEIDIYDSDGECLQKAVLHMTEFLLSYGD